MCILHMVMTQNYMVVYGLQTPITQMVSVAVIVEVKTRCGRRDIDYFLSQMEHCKEWYPDFADKKLLVAVAAIQYDEGTAVYAQKLGLYVLQLSGEETFTMEVPKNPLAF